MLSANVEPILSISANFFTGILERSSFDLMLFLNNLRARIRPIPFIWTRSINSSFIPYKVPLKKISSNVEFKSLI